MLDDQKFVHDPPTGALSHPDAGNFQKELSTAACELRCCGVCTLSFRQGSSPAAQRTAKTCQLQRRWFVHDGANVRGDEQLVEAIKTVWASVWNFEATKRANAPASIMRRSTWRADSGRNQFGKLRCNDYGDPFNREINPINKGSIYISAKRGLGMKVVEGQRIAEQVVYRPIANAVQV